MQLGRELNMCLTANIRLYIIITCSCAGYKINIHTLYMHACFSNCDLHAEAAEHYIHKSKFEMIVK